MRSREATDTTAIGKEGPFEAKRGISNDALPNFIQPEWEYAALLVHGSAETCAMNHQISRETIACAEAQMASSQQRL